MNDNMIGLIVLVAFVLFGFSVVFISEVLPDIMDDIDERKRHKDEH